MAPAAAYLSFSPSPPPPNLVALLVLGCAQVKKQLQDVTHVVMVAVGDRAKGIVERDLMMIKVATQTKTDRIGLIQLANVFSAKTVDVMEHHIMLELSSHPAEIERFIELCTSCVPSQPNHPTRARSPAASGHLHRRLPRPLTYPLHSPDPFMCVAGMASSRSPGQGR